MAKSGSSLRLITVLPIAAVVTAGLFVAMSALVQTEAEPREPTEPPDINFIMDEREPPSPAPLPPPEPLPPAPKPPKPDWKVDPTPNPGPAGPIDEPVIDPKPRPLPTLERAIITPPPQYPPSCQGSGTEGHATVVFDVTASGAVVNARVVSSSHNCFNSPSIRAIQKWKFQPTGSGGSQVVQSGLRKTFIFKLTE